MSKKKATAPKPVRKQQKSREMSDGDLEKVSGGSTFSGTAQIDARGLGAPPPKPRTQ
jgi:hypothetical protein